MSFIFDCNEINYVNKNNIASYARVSVYCQSMLDRLDKWRMVEYITQERVSRYIKSLQCRGLYNNVTS